MLTRRTAIGGIVGVGLAAAGGALFPSLASAATTYVITNCNTSVNVRSGPGTSNRKVGNIAKGSTFTGEQSGAWVKITSGQFNGSWVSSTYAIATGGTSGGTAQPQPASPYTTAITAVSGGVIGLRLTDAETFLEAYRRVGPKPFKEALYGGSPAEAA